MLIVEDEPLLREAAAEALRREGLEVVEAASAEDALVAVERAPHGPPSVVVADLYLGQGMDGLTLGAEMLRRWPAVGVVYATGHPEAIDGRFLGPRERYLVKPFTPAAVVSAVHRLMPSGVLGWTWNVHSAAKRAIRSERAAASRR